MNYWDSSGLVPLLVGQSNSDLRKTLLQREPGIITWWGSAVECASAFNRLHREQLIEVGELAELHTNLARFESRWDLVPPITQVKQIAMRCLRVHALRAADSLQLAAALVAADGDPAALGFVTDDARLANAALQEGFRLR